MYELEVNLGKVEICCACTNCRACAKPVAPAGPTVAAPYPRPDATAPVDAKTLPVTPYARTAPPVRPIIPPTTAPWATAFHENLPSRADDIPPAIAPAISPMTPVMAQNGTCPVGSLYKVGLL